MAEVFTGAPGKYVSLAETIRGFKMICAGECDHLPEQAFYMVGTIDEAFEKSQQQRPRPPENDGRHALVSRSVPGIEPVDDHRLQVVVDYVHAWLFNKTG